MTSTNSWWIESTDRQVKLERELVVDFIGQATSANHPLVVAFYDSMTWNGAVNPHLNNTCHRENDDKNWYVFFGSPKIRIPQQGLTLWGYKVIDFDAANCAYRISSMTSLDRDVLHGYHANGLAHWGDKLIHSEYWLTLINVLDPNTSDSFYPYGIVGKPAEAN